MKDDGRKPTTDGAGIPVSSDDFSLSVGSVGPIRLPDLAGQADDLRRVAEADELHVAPHRDDRVTHGTPTGLRSVAGNPMIRVAMLMIATLPWIAISPIDAAMAREGSELMEIVRKSEQKTIEGPEAYFTGKATITGQFRRESPSRVTGAIVRFEPGARTAWHSHPLGQTLIVTEGVGWTQVEGGPKYEFRAGDVMWCPPEHKHWHGATPHEAMTHIAIQEAKDGENVTWMEKVTDEEYLAGEPETERQRE